MEATEAAEATEVGEASAVHEDDDDAAVSVPIEMDGPDEQPEGAPALDGCGLPVAEGGGALSPLSGAYLLIVLAEPISEKHKVKMMQKLKQGKTNIFNFFHLVRSVLCLAVRYTQTIYS